jgi:methionyl-tRNA formyltransferase
MSMQNAPILLITDPNLGDAALARVAQSCFALDHLRFDVRKERREEAIEKLVIGKWHIAVSFYSDLVLPPDLLCRIGLPLNIHPALPRIRGVGQDIVPLVEQHDEFGATLHRMDETIDTGRIYATARERLPAGMASSALRGANQKLCLSLLDWLCRQIESAGLPEDLDAALEASAAMESESWGGYYSRKRVEALVASAAPALQPSPI